MDWSEIFESSSPNDFPRYSAVSEHFEDQHEYQVRETDLPVTVVTFCSRLAQLISIFVSVWLTAAGIIHLVSQHSAHW